MLLHLCLHKAWVILRLDLLWPIATFCALCVGNTSEPCKMAEPFKMPFLEQTCLRSGYHVLDGVCIGAAWWIQKIDLYQQRCGSVPPLLWPFVVHACCRERWSFAEVVGNTSTQEERHTTIHGKDYLRRGHSAVFFIYGLFQICCKREIFLSLPSVLWHGWASGRAYGL